MVSANLNFRVWDLSAINGTSGRHVLNPGLKEKKANVGYLQRYNHILKFKGKRYLIIAVLARLWVLCQINNTYDSKE